NSMDLGLDGRLRPLAVVVEPPEAAPGETVQVTMTWLDPDPAQTTVRWRIALQYVTGIYNTTVETDLADVPGVPAPVCDADGFCAQTVAYTIPDDASRRSPALDYLAAQPTLADAAHAVSPDLAGKLAIDDYLRALAPADATAADL